MKSVTDGNAEGSVYKITSNKYQMVHDNHVFCINLDNQQENMYLNDIIKEFTTWERLAPRQKANLNTNMLQVKSATSATDNNSNEMKSERSAQTP